MTTRSYLIVMELHALSLQPAGAHRSKAETTGQELQPDGGEQGGGLEGRAGPVRTPGLAALLLHARDQHHNLVERLQPQLEGVQQNLRFYSNICLLLTDDTADVGYSGHLRPALLLLHGQDRCLWAGGHAFFWLLEGWSQAHIPADEADHVVDESMDAERAAQVQVRLFVEVGRAIAPLATQFGPEPGLSQGIWGAVEQTCRRGGGIQKCTCTREPV